MSAKNELFLSLCKKMETLISTIPAKMTGKVIDRKVDKLLVSGDLAQAALSLYSMRNSKSKLILLTGFPCNYEYTPPTETDGIAGAIAIAKVMHTLSSGSVSTYFLSDECNKVVLKPAIEKFCSFATLKTFSPLKTEASLINNIFNDLSANDTILAIERVGPNASDKYKTMSNIDVSHTISPLDLLFKHSLEKIERNINTIGIGDGGNEIGMGKVYNNIVKYVPLGQEIGCTVSCNSLLSTVVSNWGGYALSAALAILGYLDNLFVEFNNLDTYLCNFIPSNAHESELIDILVANGARDGITKQPQRTVDNYPWEIQVEILEKLRQINHK